jgi:hypothetical protein
MKGFMQMNYPAANSTKFQSAEDKGLCPVCGEVMKEVDRIKEGLHFFVWFKCGTEHCNGQWLQKRPACPSEQIEEPTVNNPQKTLTLCL